MISNLPTRPLRRPRRAAPPLIVLRLPRRRWARATARQRAAALAQASSIIFDIRRGYTPKGAARRAAERQGRA